MTKTAALLSSFALASTLSCSSSSGEPGVDGGAPATGNCMAIADVPPTVCSMMGAARMASFANHCSIPVDIWWVNYQCGETFYHRLKSGESYTQPSFVTHPWRARTVPADGTMGTTKGMLIKEFGAIPAGTDTQMFALP